MSRWRSNSPFRYSSRMQAEKSVSSRSIFNSYFYLERHSLASNNTDEEEAVVSPNETNNLMGIIEEEDSSIDFNSSLRSKPLSDGGDKLH